MPSITSFAINTSRLTITAILGIVFVGVYLFVQFPRLEDPPIVIREAVITAAFPGMDPLQVEDLITRRIEEEIRTMPEIDEITSESKTGITVIHAILRDEYEDLEAIWKRLRNKMDDVRPQLPEGTVGPLVYDEFGLTAVATIALWSDGFSMAEMRLVARDVRDRLYELKGIRKVELYGVQDEQVYLKFSNAKLAQFGISIYDVLTTLQQQNVILPGGTVEVEERDVVIEPSGDFQSIEDIEAVLISIPESDQLVNLTELVSVERGYVDPPTSLAYSDGRPAVVISLSITPGVNSVEFGRQLTRKIRELEAGLPVGYVMEYATFQPDLVQAAVDGALSNVYQTLVTVLVVVILFLRLRAGLIVGSFVPITMLLGLIVMWLMDIELHRVSILSAIVALGMLVDNAIVVVEDIRARMERGQDRREACLASGQTLAIPLLTSSLTTILAFLPMLLIDGQTGEYAFALPMVVIILLLASWVLSMYMTPAVCNWFLVIKAPGGGAEPGEDPYDSGFYRRYRALLEFVLKQRYATLAVTIGLLVVAGYAASSLVREFFGPSDRNQFLVYFDLPAGSRIQTTDEVVQQYAAWLGDEAANPEVTSSIAYVGTGGPRFFLSLSPKDPDPHRGFLVVNTAEADQVPEVIKRSKIYLAESFPDVEPQLKRMWMGSSEPGLLEIRLIGIDAEHLFAKGHELEQAFQDMPGIDYSLIDWENKVLKVNVVVDQSRARRAGVTSREIATSLNAFMDGAQITDYREGDTAIPVVFRAVEDERQTLGDLWNVNVYSSAREEMVPLSQVADFRGEWEYNRIARYNQERTVTVDARHQHLKAPELLAAMTPTIEALGLKLGHRWEVGGEIEDSEETNEKLFRYMPACVIGIVVLLIWQFNSFRRPTIIMLTIPMAFAGALVGLIIMRAPFDFFGILGLLSLAGVIMNNGIVLIDRIDSQRAAGLSDYEAVVFAAVSRFRPILMSATTTILGVLPLIILVDPLFFSMACVIAFGLALGTVLTLLLVPVLYALFFSVKSPAGSSP
ncbi:MAG: efflux RND transporter permease subunit [Kiloniellales bacterium]|nr:efflux RND transporter permease subunit [Kiloniellales bacterium]